MRVSSKQVDTTPNIHYVADCLRAIPHTQRFKLYELVPNICFVSIQ